MNLWWLLLIWPASWAIGFVTLRASERRAAVTLPPIDNTPVVAAGQSTIMFEPVHAPVGRQAAPSGVVAVADAS